MQIARTGDERAVGRRESDDHDIDTAQAGKNGGPRGVRRRGRLRRRQDRMGPGQHGRRARHRGLGGLHGSDRRTADRGVGHGIPCPARRRDPAVPRAAMGPPGIAAPTRFAGMAGVRDHDPRRAARSRRDRRQSRRRPTRSDAHPGDLHRRLHMLRRARAELRGHGLADSPLRGNAGRGTPRRRDPPTANRAARTSGCVARRSDARSGCCSPSGSG